MLIPVKELLKITVESDFYSADDENIRIEDYYATRLTKRSLDVQIDFIHPESLAQSKQDPDKLKIEFIHGEFFIDEKNFAQLDAEIELDIDIQP